MSKESDYYADFEYISFNKFSFTHKKQRAREILYDFWKK